MDTVSRVFFAVAKDNLHTRKEIAAALGVSLVTVGKAVGLLTAAGILSSSEKCESDVGRRSNFIDVSSSANILMIDLSGRDLAYSYAPLGESSANASYIPHLDSLDFADNFVLLINDIKKHLVETPTKIFVALPGEVNGRRVKDALIRDYSGFDIVEMLDKRGLHVDILVSCANAVEVSESFRAGDVFISVSDAVWGTFGRGKIENWSNALVDSRGELTYIEALRCSHNEEKLADYSLRFLREIDGILAPERILLSSDRLSDGTMDLIQRNMPKIVPVVANEMIFDGLMELAMAKILKEISNKR